MSFPRAKLQRFNETQSSTPSPADYNVSLRSHVAGAVIPKSDRFSELPSPSHSDNGSFVSNNSKPTFRTPNVPRRMKRQTSVDRVDQKTTALSLFQTADDIEALKEKIVECNNKDLYIKELTEQLEEMKQQLSDLESQISHLKVDKLQLEENLEKLNGRHENSLKDLQANHECQLGKLGERIAEVNGKMELMKMEYVKLKQENQMDLAEVLKNITTLEALHDALADSYKHLLEQKTKEVEIKEELIRELEEECVNLRTNHNSQMDCAKYKHEEELRNIEYEMLRTVTEMQKELEKEKQNRDNCLKELFTQKQIEFNGLQVQFENEKLKLQNDSEAKIKQLMENYKETTVLAEMQMKEKCTDIELSWQLKLEEAKGEAEAILKECQAIAEYNIIQCEVEKNNALRDLSEQNKTVDTLQTENKHIKAECHNLTSKCKLLQAELSNVIVELNSVREKLTAELQMYKSSTDQLTRDKHTYEVTILKTHKTVETLRRRLMRSDQDVEQLKAELEATEESKLEFEGKCNRLTDELQIVCGLCDDMEEQNEMALRIAEEKVFNVEQQLLDKVENYKQQAKDEVLAISEELQKTKEQLALTLTHLHEQEKLIAEAHILSSKSSREIERLESVNAKSNLKIIHLEAAVNNIQVELASAQAKEAALKETNKLLESENEKLKTVVELVQTNESYLVKHSVALNQECAAVTVEGKDAEALADVQNKYDELLGKYDDLAQKLSEKEDENAKLQKKIAEQESLIGPFREHLEAYEMEYNALMDQKQNAEKEAKEMGLKYAEILGHQNQKQKIKHLIDLKKKNYELSENKRELEIKVRTQTRTIEKLKKELLVAAKSPRKLKKTEDKENTSSPNRTLNSSRLDSPSGPLRDRN